MKILTVIGARPQFVKAGSVSREIHRRKVAGDAIDEVTVHTGQHFDENMSKVFFDEMEIPEPDYHLGIGGVAHGAMTGRMIEKIEAIIVDEDPDCLLVYGDTNSTLAGAIAASKLQVGIGHVEAGMRSFNMSMPEEINRILTDRVSRLLFCSTEVAMENLEKEGISNWQNSAESVLTGDVMLDSALYYRQRASEPADWNGPDEFALCTIHRAENTDDTRRLGEILSALVEISHRTPVVLPLHPRTRKVIEHNDLDVTGIQILPPQGYLAMIWLLDRCNLVVTDSGGVQKEAYFFAKPCITLRDETEWVELVTHDYNRLAGCSRDRILEAFDRADFNLDFSNRFYGNGRASEIIVARLAQVFGGSETV